MTGLARAWLNKSLEAESRDESLDLLERAAAEALVDISEALKKIAVCLDGRS